jgi:hypothetical protein
MGEAMTYHERRLARLQALLPVEPQASGMLVYPYGFRTAEEIDAWLDAVTRCTCGAPDCTGKRRVQVILPEQPAVYPPGGPARA